MKAAILTAFGAPLTIGELPDPVPATDELLVRVRSVTINRALDQAVCVGRWPVPPPLPHVPGIDPAGEIVAVGSAVTTWSVGDRVAFGSVRCGRCISCTTTRDSLCVAARMPGVAFWGGMAELVALPARAAFRIPPDVSFVDAAYAVRHGGLALHMLGHPLQDKRVLVTGASGALGSAAVQLARAQGADVTGWVGSEAKRAALANRDFAVSAVGSGTDFDLAVETTGTPDVWQAAFAALALGASLIGSSGAGSVALDLRRLYTRRLRVTGAALGNTDDSVAALGFAAAGALRAPVAARFALDHIAEALALAADRDAIGKIVIEPHGEPQ